MMMDTYLLSLSLSELESLELLPPPDAAAAAVMAATTVASTPAASVTYNILYKYCTDITTVILNAQPGVRLKYLTVFTLLMV